MQVLIPNKEYINIDKLKKVLVIGLTNTAGPTPAVFSFDIPVDKILDLKYFEISDEDIEKIDKIQFKYIHEGSIKIGNWFKDTKNLIKDMKIGIPDFIKNNSENIESLKIEAVYIISDNIIFDTKSFDVEDISFKILGFSTIPVEVFNLCTKLQFRISHKNKTTEIFKLNNKYQAIFKSNIQASAQLCVRHKTSDLFEDTNDGRYACLDELQKRFNETLYKSIETAGNKNLIYYTIYFNKGYIELLNKSILSILDKSEPNFDLLLITDEETKINILKQPFVEKITPKFLITPTPFDGVEASQNKVLVFNYENIKEYDKVLFLDCDIVCLKNVNNIFKQNLEHDVLYTARNSNLSWWHHKTFHHGFEFLGDDYVKEMTFAKQMPFNAGQFLFRISDRMKSHFDNVIWFMANWTGEYFFEQAFMNYYFCKNYLTEDVVFNQKVTVISTNSLIDYNITDKTCLAHFIAPPLDAKTKLAFIEEFEKTQKKPSFFKKLLDKIKLLFKKIFKRHEQSFTY